MGLFRAWTANLFALLGLRNKRHAKQDRFTKCQVGGVGRTQRQSPV